MPRSHRSRGPSHRSSVRVAALAGALLLPTAAQAGRKKKTTEPPPPITGWHMEEGWTHQCYFPPQWEKLQETDRKGARARSLDEMMTQWRGEREDGVTMPEGTIEQVEVTLLGRPTAIEGAVRQNLELCQASATGAGTGAWTSWLRGLSSKLTAGECLTPLDYTMFDYLDIGNAWQRTLPICKGDKIRITGTLKDKYRVRDGGPWINVEGDPERSTSGDEAFPCSMEGCFEGGLVFRFVSEQGVEVIRPIGQGLIFSAPEHGEISYRINDEQFFDNVWYKSGGIIDRTAIEVSPAAE